MTCFDYEEVQCVICEQKYQDGYIKLKGKIICDECGLEVESKMQKTKFGPDVKLDMKDIENIHKQSEESLDKDIEKLSKEQGWKGV